MAYNVWSLVRNQWHQALPLYIIYRSYSHFNPSAHWVHHSLSLNVHHSNRSFFLYHPGILEHH